MPYHRLVLFAAALLIGAASATAQEAKRFALLIGNQGYNAKVGPLKTPHNDIALVGAALRSLGFKVIEIKDADYTATDTAIKRYAQSMRREGEGSIGLLYYSGHGAADPDTKTNYLIPVDVPNADDADLWTNSLNLNQIVESLREQAPNATHYVVFDACRNELNLTRKGKKALTDKGFVPMAYTPGVMVAYATAPGQTATDIGSGGGPYAKALADEIVKPGVEAMSMFRRVALRVNREIGQDPWMSASTLPEIYFAGLPEPRAEGAQPGLPAGVRPPTFSEITAGGLFTEEHAKALTSLAEKHRLPLPDFRIEVPDPDVPANLRRFVGIWINETGFSKGYQNPMIIATRVHKDGKLDGYLLWGPPGSAMPRNFRVPAGIFQIAGTITGRTLRFRNPPGDVNFSVTLTDANRMNFVRTSTRVASRAKVLRPVWMLVEAERSAKH
jgi:hypothetical protein